MSTVKNKKPARSPKPLRVRINVWLRWLHIYISMFCLLAILFFSLTGITLNHPEWKFNNIETQTEVEGTFPETWKKGTEVDWLQTVEFLRTKYTIRGPVQEHQLDGNEGTVSFKGPGYAADCFFEADTGRYQMTIIKQGIGGVMNDFHRGASSGRAWAWLIDLSGIMLTIVSLTGFGLLIYLKKVRTPAIAVMVAGIVIVIVLMKMVS